MEEVVPSNYLPQGREKSQNGFGYITNKNQYDWLQESAISTKRYDDLTNQINPAFYRYVRESKESIQKKVDLYAYRTRILNSRPPSEFKLDPLSSDCRVQQIYNMKI